MRHPAASDPASRSAEAPIATRWIVLVGLGLAVVAFLASLTEMRDPDAFHHLALGRDILRRGGFAPNDPFLYPLAAWGAGAAPYWLGAIFIYLSHWALGDPGPVLLAATMSALLVAVLFADVRGVTKRWPELLVALVPLALAIGVVRGRAVPRPEIFATALVALTALAIRRFDAGGRRALFAFPVLAALWNNAHASLALGCALVLAYAGVEGALELWRRARGAAPASRAPLRPFVVAAGIAVAGGVVGGLTSPAGFGPLVLALSFVTTSTLGSSQTGTGDVLARLKHTVQELQPMSLADWQSELGALALLGLFSFVVAGRRARAWEAVVAGGLLVLAAQSARYGVFAAVVAAPVVARNLVFGVERLRAWRGPGWRVPGAAGLALACLVGVGLHNGRRDDLRFGVGLRPEAYPVAAAKYLAATGAHPKFFNTFHFGGYLEWVLDQQVFQDGRGGLLPEDAEAALAGPMQRLAFAGLDARYRFDALIVAHPSGTALAEAEAFDATAAGADWVADRQTWALVAFDDGGLLYLRRDGPLAALAARDEYVSARPGNPYADRWLRGPGVRPAWIADYRRAVTESPRCRKCLLHLGLALVYGGQAEEATRVLRQALPGATRRFAADVWHGLGIAAELEGRLDDARAAYGEVLAGNPKNAAVRRALATLELERRDAKAAWRALEPNLEGSPTGDDLTLGVSVQRALGDDGAAQVLAAKLGGAALRQRAEALYLEGVTQLQARNVAGAEHAFRASLKIIETNAAAHANLGWTLYEQGQKDAALVEFRRATEVDPRQAEAQYGVGLVLAERKERAGAAEGFREYLRLQPRGFWSQKAEEQLRLLQQ